MGAFPFSFPVPFPFSPPLLFPRLLFFPFPFFPGRGGHMGGGCNGQGGGGDGHWMPSHPHLVSAVAFFSEYDFPETQFRVLRQIYPQHGDGHAAGQPLRPPGWRCWGEHGAGPPRAEPRAQLGTNLPGASPSCCRSGLCVSWRKPPSVNLRKRPILRYLCSQWDPSRSFILPL